MLIGCLQIQNYGLGPALSVPLVPMAIFDIPRRNKWVWQSVVLASVWVSASANIVDMYTCHLYIPALKSCGNKYGQSLKTMPSTDSSSLQGLPGNAGRLCYRASPHIYGRPNFSTLRSTTRRHFRSSPSLRSVRCAPSRPSHARRGSFSWGPSSFPIESRSSVTVRLSLSPSSAITDPSVDSDQHIRVPGA